MHYLDMNRVQHGSLLKLDYGISFDLFMNFFLRRGVCGFGKMVVI